MKHKQTIKWKADFQRKIAICCLDSLSPLAVAKLDLAIQSMFSKINDYTCDAFLENNKFVVMHESLFVYKI